MNASILSRIVAIVRSICSSIWSGLNKIWAELPVKSARRICSSSPSKRRSNKTVKDTTQRIAPCNSRPLRKVSEISRRIDCMYVAGSISVTLAGTRLVTNVLFTDLWKPLERVAKNLVFLTHALQECLIHKVRVGGIDGNVNTGCTLQIIIQLFAFSTLILTVKIAWKLVNKWPRYDRLKFCTPSGEIIFKKYLWNTAYFSDSTNEIRESIGP